MEFVFNVDAGMHETSVRCSLLEAVKFMAAFIDQQNEQTRFFCSRFDQASRDAHGFDYDDERDELHVSRISDYEYDLDGVFKEEFPIYVIESQVIMLWSMLERNLDAVATELYSIKGISWTKLKGDGSLFSKYIDRIESADGVPFDKSNFDFLENNVRIVRNALVHGGVREVGIIHEYLDVSGGILRDVSTQYVSLVIESMQYLAMELMAANR